jgi:hypothetical protein
MRASRLLRKAVQQGRSKRPKIGLPISFVYFILGMARMSPTLRASNEGLRRPRVARAQGTPGHPSLLADFINSLRREGLASSDLAGICNREAHVDGPCMAA